MHSEMTAVSFSAVKQVTPKATRSLEEDNRNGSRNRRIVGKVLKVCLPCKLILGLLKLREVK